MKQIYSGYEPMTIVTLLQFVVVLATIWMAARWSGVGMRSGPSGLVLAS